MTDKTYPPLEDFDFSWMKKYEEYISFGELATGATFNYGDTASLFRKVATFKRVGIINYSVVLTEVNTICLVCGDTIKTLGHEKVTPVPDPLKRKEADNV